MRRRRRPTRVARVNEVLRQVVAEELERLADADERLRLVTVTSVDDAPDLRTAVVYLASLDDEPSLALEERRGHLQRTVGRQVTMKRTPRLASAPTRPSPPAPGWRSSCGGCTRGAPAATRPESPADPGSSARRAGAGRSPSSVTGSWSSTRRPGWTSHDVVARCRRIFGQRRVGHAGTLDPDATGVLLVGLGRATRLLRFLTALAKTYTADMVLGTATSTLDASGEVTGTWDMARVTPDAVAPPRPRSPATSSRCRRWSRPSRSADGDSTSLARQGIEVERPARPVTVYRFDVEPDPGRPGVFRAEVECSSGTYVRVLAADLGRRSAAGRTCATCGARASAPSAEAEMRPLDAHRPRRRPHARRGAARPGPRRRSSRRWRRHPDRDSRSTGCRSGRPATGRGRCSTDGAAAGGLRGDGHRPHPAGRRAGRET